MYAVGSSCTGGDMSLPYKGVMAMTQKKPAFPAIASEKIAASADRFFRFTLPGRGLHEIFSCVLCCDYD